MHVCTFSIHIRMYACIYIYTHTSAECEGITERKRDKSSDKERQH